MKVSALLLATVLLVMSCNRREDALPALVVTGATIIDGTPGPPVHNAVLIIRDGQVVAIGSRDDIEIPSSAERLDMSGKFITPGFINAHGHVGDVKGIEGGHYSRENVIANLATYARYGITTVVSLGGDKQESVLLRDARDSVATGRARLYIAGEVITGATPDQALAVVDANHQMGVDFMKIRVDDNLGTATKMTEDVYASVIQRSHELGYKIATHMYYLSDAKKLLRAGSDLMAHSVRDAKIDSEFIDLMKAGNVCYCPTLTREISTFVYGDTASFFSDPFFYATYDSITVKPLLDPARQRQVRDSKSGITYRQQLPTAMANLKMVADAGIPIAFGTDSGVPTRFIGYFEHLEMDMMQQAGLSPSQIIQSATAGAAGCLGLRKVGTLKPGHRADFVVLDADPMADIKNMRFINAVYVGGQRLETP